MLSAFENLVHPYPERVPPIPPKKFLAFLWACSHGLRRYILAMTLLTAAIGAFEALLYSMLGNVVDWLSAVPNLPTSANLRTPAHEAERTSTC